MSTYPQVGSMCNEGTSNAQKKGWEGGGAMSHTREGNDAHYMGFLLGTPSL